MDMHPYPKLKRTPDGRYMSPHGVIAADLVALVAGVSGGSVAKVLIALEALSEVLSIDPRYFIIAKNVPTEPAGEIRRADTDKYARYLAETYPQVMARYEDDLHFLKRYHAGKDKKGG